MLGIAKGAGGYQSPAPPTDVAVSITPQDFNVASSNGSYTTPFFKSSVSNGVGPFTYAWTFDDGEVMSPSSDKTRLVVSGYNTIVQGVLRLTVTDTGDSNKTATASTSVFISFENFNL
jgi:hypothetical protein